MVGMLHVHPSRVPDLREPDEVSISPEAKVESYIDSYGNRCARWLAPAGPLHLSGSTVIEDPGTPDEGDPEAQEHPVNELPPELLRYLLNSRYCEVDRLSNIAVELFGQSKAGMEPRASDLRLGELESGVRISSRALVEDSSGRVYRAYRSLPRFSAPGSHVLPSAKHSGALRYGIPGRYRGTQRAYAHGFQCLVRSLSAEPLVDLRRSSCEAAHWAGVDGDGTGRF
jgi:hypothetical protein